MIEEAKYYLKPQEQLDKVPQMIQELETAYTERKKHIQKLHDEIRQIKKLTV